MVGREQTPDERDAWRKQQLQVRANQAGNSKIAARKAVDMARTSRLAGDRQGAVAKLKYAAGERGIAFRFGADTQQLAQNYGQPMPSRTASIAPGPAATAGATPPNKSRGRRSWMPGKGLG